MRLVSILSCTLISLASPFALAQVPRTSQLWGESGEMWSGPAGRLPDYSYAGYHRGEEPIPDVPVTANVKSFGAKGDGVTNDTAAFQSAIAGTPSGALLIPAGKYVLSNVLRIKRNDFVLRGEGSGPGGTELFFTKPLNTLKPNGAVYWKQGKSGLIVVGSSKYDNDNTVLGPKLGNVTVAAKRGDTTVYVGNAGAFKPGSTVYLKMTEDSAGSLNWVLNNNLFPGGTCSWDPAPLEWPVQIEAVNGNLVTLAQPLRFDVQLKWKPTFYEFVEFSEVGIEHLKVSFTPHAYPGHHLEEGYNGIAFEGMLNSWIRDVALESFDNGIVFELTKNSTISGVTLLPGIDDPATAEFHHGLWFNRGSADNLLENFSIEAADGLHDVSISAYASGNVIRAGKMVNGELDHHQGAPFANLFSDLDMGANPTWIWTSGGGSCGSPSYAGVHNTYWNVRSGDPSWVDAGTGVSAPSAPPWKKVLTNVIPAQWNNMTPDKEWLEVVDDIYPADLYLSQLANRVGSIAQVQTLGAGCGVGTKATTMIADDPLLGQPLTFKAAGAPPLALAQLVVGKPVAVPLALGGACNLYFSTSSFLMFPLGLADTQGRWTQTVKLPDDPSLVGQQLVAQTMFSTGAPLYLGALTNGLQLTLGY